MPPDQSHANCTLRDSPDPETLRLAVEGYLDALRMAGRMPRTVSLYQSVLSLWWSGGIASVLRPDLAPATRAHRYQVLRGFVRWATDQGYTLGQDPLAGVPRPRLAALEPRAIPQGDLDRITRVVIILSLPHRALFTLLLETGLREAEACSLRVRDLDLTTPGSEGIHVHGKGGKERFVPLPAGFESRRLLRRLIQAHPAPDAFVFSKDGIRPWDTSTVRRAWGRLTTRAGVKGYSVHSLRHTAATRLVESVGDLALVQRLLGHASLSTTGRYAMRGDQALRRAMEQMGRMP